ncbi:ester cyclase [Paroceanicella profunda]|uniref:ester cyclase n=1 Tax=Paroceanicella profunda TaxID=2579971 RepID=UPI001EF12075|nr:ester cyclase [Paroceanicella profunda]
MDPAALTALYHGYIACLNARDWARLGEYVGDSVRHNGRPLGLAGYRAMLEGDVATIPDLRFEVRLLAADPPVVAARLWFDCHPKAGFLGLPVNGRRVCFAENVFTPSRRSGCPRCGP